MKAPDYKVDVARESRGCRRVSSSERNQAARLFVKEARAAGVTGPIRVSCVRAGDEFELVPNFSKLHPDDAEDIAEVVEGKISTMRKLTEEEKKGRRRGRERRRGDT